MLKALYAAAVSLVLSFVAVDSHGQIHRVAKMRTEQIRALDKNRTVVLLPAGILEQHGPLDKRRSSGRRLAISSRTFRRAPCEENP